MHDLQVVPVTMSSLDLVKIINETREEGEPRLQHKHFLEKVPLVLGDEYSRNFGSTYRASNGKQNPCYSFPKREACLMAMSYSYELQAMVYDRMTELEQRALPAPQPVDMAAALGLVQLTFDHLPNLSEISKQAVLSGMLELVTGKALLPLPKLEEKHYTATEAGAVLGISAAKVGSLANAEGLKIPRFGYYRVQKRKGSDGQCEQWMYNEAGVEALRALLQ